MKRLFAVLFAFCLALTGMCCADELREMDVVLDWYPNALHAFMYVAIEKGYYAEEGLKVNIRFPSNINDAMSMVAAGRADVGLYYQQNVIQARANQKVPIKAIAAVVQGPLNIVLSLKDKGITAPQDLAGKTIGYSGTELSEALIRTMMAYTGTEAERVRMIDVGFDLMSAMTTGNVDATIDCMLNHEVPQLEEEGFELNWFKVDDYGVPSYYEGIFLASDNMIEHDADVLRAFLRASAKGFEDMKANPEEALRILLDNQNAENFPLSETVERRSMEMLLPVMEPEGIPFLSQSDTCWQENIEWMLQQGLITAPVTVDDVRAVL